MAQRRTEPEFASRVGRVCPFRVMEVLDRACLERLEQVRISYTASLEDLARAVDRIGELLQEGVHR